MSLLLERKPGNQLLSVFRREDGPLETLRPLPLISPLYGIFRVSSPSVAKGKLWRERPFGVDCPWQCVEARGSTIPSHIIATLNR